LGRTAIAAIVPRTPIATLHFYTERGALGEVIVGTSEAAVPPETEPATCTAANDEVVDAKFAQCGGVCCSRRWSPPVGWSLCPPSSSFSFRGGTQRFRGETGSVARNTVH
jgi:hypothetical protein